MKDQARGLDGLKIRNEKWEGPGGEARHIKDPEWKMGRTRQGGLTS